MGGTARKFTAGLVGIGLALAPVGAASAKSTTTKPTAPVLKTVSGKVASVSQIAMSLGIKVGTKTDVVDWTTSTTVTLSSKASTASKIKVGDNVTAKYTVTGTKWVASSIALKLGSTK